MKGKIIALCGLMFFAVLALQGCATTNPDTIFMEKVSDELINSNSMTEIKNNTLTIDLDEKLKRSIEDLTKYAMDYDPATDLKRPVPITYSEAQIAIGNMMTQVRVAFKQNDYDPEWKSTKDRLTKLQDEGKIGAFEDISDPISFQIRFKVTQKGKSQIRKTPWYQEWWVWTLVGAAVAVPSITLGVIYGTKPQYTGEPMDIRQQGLNPAFGR